jgi:hypothetical protein
VLRGDGVTLSLCDSKRGDRPRLADTRRPFVFRCDVIGRVLWGGAPQVAGGFPPAGDSPLLAIGRTAADPR